MGIYFTDKYSLLHFASGIIAYYWGISFILWFIIHLLYEYVENTNLGMKIINKIKMWPGGKEKSDTILNSIGDQFYGLLGWIFTFFILKIFTFNNL
jgi:hypothetical protein